MSPRGMMVVLVGVLAFVLLSGSGVSGQRCHGLHGLVEMNTEVKRSPSFMELVDQLHGMCTPEYDSYGCNTCQPYVDSRGQTICVKVICSHPAGNCQCDTLTAESAVLCAGGGHLASTAVQAATMDYRADNIRAAGARGAISPSEAAYGVNAALGMSVCSRPGQRNCWKEPPEEVSDDPVYQTPAQAQKARQAERIQQLNTGYNGLVPGSADYRAPKRNSQPANVQPWFTSDNVAPMGTQLRGGGDSGNGNSGGAIGAAGWYSLSETDANHSTSPPAAHPAAAAAPVPRPAAPATAPAKKAAPTGAVDVPHCIVVRRATPAANGKKATRGKRLCGKVRLSTKHPAAIAYAKLKAADAAKAAKKTTAKVKTAKQAKSKKVGPIQPKF